MISLCIARPAFRRPRPPLPALMAKPPISPAHATGPGPKAIRLGPVVYQVQPVSKPIALPASTSAHTGPRSIVAASDAMGHVHARPAAPTINRLLKREQR